MTLRADVLMAGASGLVGGRALPLLLRRASREGFRVLAPVRRPLGVHHPALGEVETPLAGEADLAPVEVAIADAALSVGSFVCALGTTLRDAGSRDAFSRVDRDLVLDLALLARRHGARQAVVVSSVGADPASSNFYLSVKGDLEAGLLAIGFQRVDLLHPGLLLGPRSRRRPLERIGQWVLPLLSPLMAGPLGRYRPISAGVVAAALVALTGRQGHGVHVHNNGAMHELARGGAA